MKFHFCCFRLGAVLRSCFLITKYITLFRLMLGWKRRDYTVLLCRVELRQSTEHWEGVKYWPRWEWMGTGFKMKFPCPSQRVVKEPYVDILFYCVMGKKLNTQQHPTLTKKYGQHLSRTALQTRTILRKHSPRCCKHDACRRTDQRGLGRPKNSWTTKICKTLRLLRWTKHQRRITQLCDWNMGMYREGSKRSDK